MFALPRQLYMLVITEARGKLSDSLHKTTDQFNDFPKKNRTLVLRRSKRGLTLETSVSILLLYGV